jgi:hypothetical protein
MPFVGRTTKYGRALGIALLLMCCNSRVCTVQNTEMHFYNQGSLDTRGGIEKDRRMEKGFGVHHFRNRKL